MLSVCCSTGVLPFADQRLFINNFLSDVMCCLYIHHLTASICESFWFARLPAIRRCENHCCVVYLIFWFAAWLPSHFAGFFVIQNFESTLSQLDSTTTVGRTSSTSTGSLESQERAIFIFLPKTILDLNHNKLEVHFVR
jgi:hypothetical protein